MSIARSIESASVDQNINQKVVLSVLTTEIYGLSPDLKMSFAGEMFYLNFKRICLVLGCTEIFSKGFFGEIFKHF